MYTVIVPEFVSDDLAANTLELCELFMLREEAEVPIDRFTLVSDGREASFAVGPGTYKSALVLLYLMTKSATPMFELTPYMRTIVAEYFGPTILADAARPDTRHKTVRALLGHSVYIRLTLRPGYRECLATGRDLEEVIRYAWARRETITPNSPEPFLRLALKSLFEKIEEKSLAIAASDDGGWPNQTWADRALVLQQQLGHAQAA